MPHNWLMRKVPLAGWCAMSMVGVDGERVACCARLACGVVVSHESAQLFQPWDVPTAYPLAERGLPPRGPQGLLRRGVDPSLEPMEGQHQEQRPPHDDRPGLRHAGHIKAASVERRHEGT